MWAQPEIRKSAVTRIQKNKRGFRSLFAWPIFKWRIIKLSFPHSECGVDEHETDVVLSVPRMFCKKIPDGREDVKKKAGCGSIATIIIALSVAYLTTV